MQGIVAMSKGERQRLKVVQAVQEGRCSQRQAAEQLGLSVRQVKRLCKRHRQQGAAGLVSRKRGVPGNRRIDPGEQARIVQLVGERYADFGPTLAAEYLQAHHGFAHSTETLRQWMIGAGLWQAQRPRRKRLHQLRPRRLRRGELVQIDGSPHAWLEQRGPRCTLIAFVDDATSQLLYARLEPVESTQAYLRALRHYVLAHGLPSALYSDRHSIFTKHDPEDPRPTQLQRAIGQLGIEPILAHSPQAKGRVERSFQTLQDRLVKGLRLAGACTLAQANAVLPSFVARYNERFARPPADPCEGHRPCPLGAQQLGWVTSLQYPRTLSRQLSCSWRGQLILIDTAGAPAYHLRGARVTICEDGWGAAPVVLYKDAPLAHRVFHKGVDLPERVTDDKTLNEAVDRAILQQRPLAQPRGSVPGPSHPWRRENLDTKAQRAAVQASLDSRP